MKTEKPFIKLLHSPNSGYFFDVNKNEIVAVEDEIYQYLDKSMKDEDVSNADESVKQKIEQLQEYGYLSSNKVKEVKHPFTDYLDLFLNRKVDKITLQVTQNCNFRCKYCIYSECDNENQRSHSCEKMSFEMAKKAVDFLLEHSIDSKSVNIGFYGGEPLLEFELIKQTVNYANHQFQGKELSYTITSNSTLLTDEIIEFFIANNVKLMISLDGPKDINDKNRVFASNGQGTFNSIISQIQNINDNYPDYIENLSISMVIDPENNFNEIDSLFKKYDFLKKIHISSTFVDDEDANEKKVMSNEFRDNYEYNSFLSYLNHFNRIEEKDTSPITQQKVTTLVVYMDKMFSQRKLAEVNAPGGPCLPGKLRLFSNVNGDFFPCERVSETSSVMKIGNVNSGFDYGKAKDLLNVGKLTENECKNCWAFSHCKLCAKAADNKQKLSGQKKANSCHRVRNSVEYDLLTMILFHEVQTLYNK